MKPTLYNWVWKWHFIGGLITLPVILLLAVTGGIYLFKDQYEQQQFAAVRKVTPEQKRVSYQQLWETARSNWDRTPTAMVLPATDTDAVAFVNGMFGHKSGIYLDPYTGEVTGIIQVSETDMYQVRKLHGELLLGSYGTKVVELTASWMVVLLITGICIFWPAGKGWKRFFKIRTTSRRLLFRDLHAVTAFWFSGLLLLILAGGLPWTDVFGAGYKWVQDMTHAGYPREWSSSVYQSEISGAPLTLDAMVERAKALNLPGEVSVTLPASENAVFSVFNETSQLSSMSMYHFDQYSGSLIRKLGWTDLGGMIRSRLWVMAFHQGQFGFWNWLLVLVTAIALFFLSLSALFSYLKRKPAGNWGVPPSVKWPARWVVLLVTVFCVLLPLFGVSVLLILIWSGARQLLMRR